MVNANLFRPCEILELLKSTNTTSFAEFMKKYEINIILSKIAHFELIFFEIIENRTHI